MRCCSPYWRCYYANTAAIIYVIDASDTQRLGTAKAELLAMLSEEELRDSKLLVFANKQDLPGALDEGQVSEKLGLSELKDANGLYTSAAPQKAKVSRRGSTGKWLPRRSCRSELDADVVPFQLCCFCF